MHKTYELVCRLPAQEALERIKGLLTKEGVKYTASNLSLASTQTPLVFFSIDPRLYTHSNWVGLNPFAYVSGVDVRCEPGDTGVTKVTIGVDRTRGFLFVALGVASVGLAATVMPEPAGALAFVAFTCAAWFSTVSFLGGYLIKKEIGDHLKDGKHQRR